MTAVTVEIQSDEPEARVDAVARLAEQLRALTADVLGDRDVTVRELHQLTGGASRETWSFDAHRGDGTVVELILRRDPPSATRGMAVEALALRTAREAGVPEPQVLAHSDDPALVDAPFILMERLRGEALARRILRDAEYDAVRPRLAAQCGDILARIHAMPTDAFRAVRRTFTRLPRSVAVALRMRDRLPTRSVAVNARRLAHVRPETDAPVVRAASGHTPLVSRITLKPETPSVYQIS